MNDDLQFFGNNIISDSVWVNIDHSSSSWKKKWMKSLIMTKYSQMRWMNGIMKILDFINLSIWLI
jgi:hypothetical protein